MSERPLRIVSVLTSPSLGGAEFAGVELLDALAARGHDCVLLTDLRDLGRTGRLTTAPIELGPKLSRRSWAALAADVPGHVLRLRAALRAQAPYDVLLLHFKKEQLLGLALPRALRATTAWCEWGPVPAPLRSGPLGLLYAAAGRRAGAVLAVSAGTADTVVAGGVPRGRVHVVPNIVRPEQVDFDPAGRAALRGELGIAEDALVVTCISRFNDKKPNDVLVDAIIGLDDPRVHLVLAGEGETEGELRERGRPLGARLHVLPTPWDRTPAVLSAADVVAFCPSPTEGQPLAVVNGMLARRPVVASGAEGVAGLLPADAGTIAHPEHDPAALAAALRRWLDDPAGRDAAGARGRAHVLAVAGPETTAALAERLLRDAVAAR